jgi:hypothetical protein
MWPYSVMIWNERKIIRGLLFKYIEDILVINVYQQYDLIHFSPKLNSVLKLASLTWPVSKWVHDYSQYCAIASSSSTSITPPLRAGRHKREWERKHRQNCVKWNQKWFSAIWNLKTPLMLSYTGAYSLENHLLYETISLLACEERGHEFNFAWDV